MTTTVYKIKVLCTCWQGNEGWQGNGGGEAGVDAPIAHRGLPHSRHLVSDEEQEQLYSELSADYGLHSSGARPVL